MGKPPYAQLDKGTFLIASPEIKEGIYFRSVLLICEHTIHGSFCLMVNKPLEMQLPEEILDLQEVSNPHIYMRVGGPVQPNQMMLLHSSGTIPEQAMEICEGVFLGGDLQFLQESAMNPHGPHLRLCFGYAGWSSGHLEKEFLAGDWFVHPAVAKHVFMTPPEKLWQTLLREMGGKYATLSMIPEDLSLN